MATPDDIRKGINRSEGDAIPLGFFVLQILGVSILLGDMISILLGFGVFILLLFLIFLSNFTKILLVIGLSLFWAWVTLEGAGWEWAIVVFIILIR